MNKYPTKQSPDLLTLAADLIARGETKNCLPWIEKQIGGYEYSLASPNDLVCRSWI